jgi:hypothetical protein
VIWLASNEKADFNKKNIAWKDAKRNGVDKKTVDQLKAEAQVAFSKTGEKEQAGMWN